MGKYQFECSLGIILNFLNQNSGAFAVIFAAIVSIATVVYAILTWKLVAETRKMRKAQTDPKISVTIQSREEWLSLITMMVKNIGLGPAYNIKFGITPDFEYKKGEKLSELGFMKNGLKYFAPNQSLPFFLTNMAENYEEKIGKTFEIKVTYENSIGNSFVDTYLIDFSYLEGLTQLGEPHLYKIANNIEALKKHFDHFATGFNKLNVLAYTKDDIEVEKKKQRENLENIKEKKRSETCKPKI